MITAFKRRRLYFVTDLILITLTLCIPSLVVAQWTVSSDTQTPGLEEPKVAYTSNDEGYTVEVYMDASSAVRSRFILKEGMIKLADKSCPTYQIDNRITNNNSIDGAPCLSNNQWAEYIIGRIQNNEVISPMLRAIMNGNTLTFRFRLENGDYRETRFSLRGSNQSMTDILGESVTVRTQ